MIEADLNSRHSSFSEPSTSTAIWLSQLRWIAVAGQLVVIGFVSLVLKINLPLVPLLSLVSGTAISNIALMVWASRVLRLQKNRDHAAIPSAESIGSQGLGLLLLLDVATLTCLLYFTGGAANPFIFFYFANIAVAGIILSRLWMMIVTIASVACGAWLLHHATSVSVFTNSPLDHQAPWGVTKLAFLIAFATCCGVLAYFVSMLALEVRQRDRRLAIAEKERERAQRLEALATLAAGAGHELASPLSTIAVIAGELSRSLEKHDIPDKVRRDFGLIREELNRCKDILHRMKSGAGEAAAEHLHPVTLKEILIETVSAMREPHRVEIEMERAVGDFQALLPKQALSQALRNLIQNGLDASTSTQSVHVMSTIVLQDEDRRAWHLQISDRGSGMSDDILRRVGEPFFTTKEVGEGMGLGVFLTRNVIHGLGGELRFDRNSDGGTLCTVRIPIEC
jgi:two-component system sensor histidine kinase RegB